MRARLTVLSYGALASIAALAGCGGASPPGGRISSSSLTIYASLPEQGQWREPALAIRHGAELALAQVHARVGRYRIAFVVLDASTAKAATWVPDLIANNAQQAAADKTTIGYIGEFNPGASAISIPFLNRAGIPQISPADGAAGLTTATAESFPGEPEKYYPTGTRTFARVVPSDSLEARAQVRFQVDLGCTRTYVLDDGTVYGADLANIFQHDAGPAGLAIGGLQSYQGNRGTNYGALASTMAAVRPDCIFLSATAESGAAALTAAIGAALPRARIFASDGLAGDAYLDPAQGGIPFALDHRVYVTLAPLAKMAYPAAGRAFFSQYRKRYGAAQPYAIYGFAAMSLMLAAIDRATDHGRNVADRGAVLAAMLATRDRHSVLGTYSIDANGDTTLHEYGAYRVAEGHLIYLSNIGGLVSG